MDRCWAIIANKEAQKAYHKAARFPKIEDLMDHLKSPDLNCNV